MLAIRRCPLTLLLYGNCWNKNGCPPQTQDLKIDDFSRKLMDVTAKELTEEREMALASLQ